MMLAQRTEVFIKFLHPFLMCLYAFTREAVLELWEEES
jgi:hypothetical protein